MNFTDILVNTAAEIGIQLSSEQLGMINGYYQLLAEKYRSSQNKDFIFALRSGKEQKKASDIDVSIVFSLNQMIDSLVCYDPRLFPVGSRVIDVGTGGGIPGLPLKILRPDIQLCLLDASDSRMPVLRDVIGQLDLSGVNIVRARAEEAGRRDEHREQYQVALSRAIPATLDVLAELCLPFLSLGGYYIVHKGLRDQEELKEFEKYERQIALLGGEITKIAALYFPGFPGDYGRTLIYIKKVRDTPAEYPRLRRLSVDIGS